MISLNRFFKKDRRTIGILILFLFPLLVLFRGAGGYLFSFISLDMGIIVGFMLRKKEKIVDAIEALICAIFIETLLEVLFHFNIPLYNWSPTGEYRAIFFFPDPDLFAIFIGTLLLLILSFQKWGIREFISIVLAEFIIVMTRSVGVIGISFIVLLIISLAKKKRILLWITLLTLGISLFIGREKIWYIIRYFQSVMNMRFYKWNIALSAFDTHPFWGIGFGKLPIWFYIQTGSLGLADSGLIELLTQGGILVFSAFIIGITLIAKKTSLIILAYILLVSMFYTTSLNPVVTFIFGFAIMTVKCQFIFDPPIYIHFFCLDTSQTNQRKNQNPNGTISFHTMHSHNRRDGSLPPVRFAKGE